VPGVFEEKLVGNPEDEASEVGSGSVDTSS
jgi:hypothetical protein